MPYFSVVDNILHEYLARLYNILFPWTYFQLLRLIYKFKGQTIMPSHMEYI